jgi:hypothetical protein
MFFFLFGNRHFVLSVFSLYIPAQNITLFAQLRIFGNTVSSCSALLDFREIDARGPNLKIVGISMLDALHSGLVLTPMTVLNAPLRQC